MTGLLCASDFRYHASVFLVADEVPPNLYRLKPGMRLRWVTKRRVLRVGYRKTALDYREEAETRLSRPEVVECRARLESALGLHRRKLDLAHLVARILADQDGLGGPERGIWVESRNEEDWLVRPEDEAPIVVKSTYCVRLGTYYSPSGSGEDYEDGGLSSPRTVILVVGEDMTTYISGDLERLP